MQNYNYTLLLKSIEVGCSVAILNQNYYRPGPGVTNLFAIPGRYDTGNFDPRLTLKCFETKDSLLSNVNFYVTVRRSWIFVIFQLGLA